MIQRFICIAAISFCCAAGAFSQEIGGDIFAAIHLNDVAAVKSMIAENFTGTRNARREGGISPLHYAVKMNRLEIVNLLLRSGMPVDLTTSQMLTPAHWAADEGRSDCLRLLLKRNANVDAAASNGWTPLHFAARKGNIEVAGFLLDAGAAVDAVDKKGRTPLFYAVASGNEEMVKLLIKSKATIEILNKAGQRPVDFAKSDSMKKLLAKTAGQSAKVQVAEPSVARVASTNKNTVVATKAVSVGTAQEVTARKAAPVALIPKQTVVEQKIKPAVIPESVSDAPTVAVSAAKERFHAQSRESTAPLTAPLGREEAVTRRLQTAVHPLAKEVALEEAAPVRDVAPVREYNPNYRTIPMADGSVYNGELRRDKFHGHGVLDYPDGQSYDGEWVRGRKSGTGVFTYANGDKYSGEWRNDVPHGKGVFEYSNGGRIDGIWNKGIMSSGHGVYISADGVKYWGMWENNELKQTHSIEK